MEDTTQHKIRQALPSAGTFYSEPEMQLLCAPTKSISPVPAKAGTMALNTGNQDWVSSTFWIHSQHTHSHTQTHKHTCTVYNDHTEQQETDFTWSSFWFLPEHFHVQCLPHQDPACSPIRQRDSGKTTSLLGNQPLMTDENGCRNESVAQQRDCQCNSVNGWEDYRLWRKSLKPTNVQTGAALESHSEVTGNWHVFAPHTTEYQTNTVSNQSLAKAQFKGTCWHIQGGSLKGTLLRLSVPHNMDLVVFE